MAPQLPAASIVCKSNLMGFHYMSFQLLGEGWAVHDGKLEAHFLRYDRAYRHQGDLLHSVFFFVL